MKLHRENWIVLELEHWHVTNIRRCNAAWLSARVRNVQICVPARAFVKLLYIFFHDTYGIGV